MMDDMSTCSQVNKGATLPCWPSFVATCGKDSIDPSIGSYVNPSIIEYMVMMSHIWTNGSGDIGTLVVLQRLQAPSKILACTNFGASLEEFHLMIAHTRVHSVRSCEYLHSPCLFIASKSLHADVQVMLATMFQLCSKSLLHMCLLCLP